MADIYDIDFKQQGHEIMPPDKRDDNTNILVASLLSAIQWTRDLFFTSYRTGSTAQNYGAGIYNKNEQVIFEKAVYYSLIDGNTNIPTDTTTWLRIQENFIGVNERVKFNTQNIVLEYALNKRFNGTFRPPGSSSLSDIYLTNVPVTATGFRIGQTESFSSTVGQTLSVDKVGARYTFIHVNNFQINILSSLYAQTNESAIRDFTNLYIAFSLRFTIQQY
jgi:hypothetical protein